MLSGTPALSFVYACPEPYGGFRMTRLEWRRSISLFEFPTLLSAHRETMQESNITTNEGFFFATTPSLNLFLCFDRICHFSECMLINEFDWTAFVGKAVGSMPS